MGGVYCSEPFADEPSPGKHRARCHAVNCQTMLVLVRLFRYVGVNRNVACPSPLGHLFHRVGIYRSHRMNRSTDPLRALVDIGGEQFNPLDPRVRGIVGVTKLCP